MRRLLSVLAVVAAGTAGAQSLSQPAQLVLGYERVKLPGGETMGLAQLSELAEFAPGWWAGPSVYGAATGRRGGLFTWGAEVQHRWRVGSDVEIGAGLYVGAGGGAAAPVGGGLMLRPHAEAWWNLGTLQAGVGIAQVRFPNGEIRSNQIGVMLGYGHRVRYTAPGSGLGDGGNVGLRRAGLTFNRYSRGNANGAVGTVGARASWLESGYVATTLEIQGAATGGADGYAEILGGLMTVWPVVPDRLALGLRGQLGLAGGGGVPTGGGTVGKLSLTGSLRLGDWIATLETGKAKSFGGSFDSPFVQLTVDTGFGEMLDPLRNTTVAFTAQHWQRAQRKTGGEPGISAIGFKLRRDLGQPWYLAAQAHCAATGGAGAFSIGLVGGGAQWRPGGGPWRVGAEVMAGAAGGGGIDNGGGALGQAMVWAGRDIGRYSRVEVGAGAIKSLRGKLSTPMVEASWTFEFGLR